MSVRKNVAVDMINREGTQMRAAMSADHIESLTDAIVAKVALPPVELVWDVEAGRYWIVDGYHRVLAHLFAKQGIIDALVTDGTREDAAWAACAANAQHLGLRRTNADKRVAVRAALAHRQVDETEMSNRDIADHCGVSHTFVRDVRAEVNGPPTPPQVETPSTCPPKSAKRRGRDGKTYPAPLPKPPKVPAEAKAVAVTAPLPAPAPLRDVAEASGGSNRDGLGQPIPEALGEAWQRLTARAGIVLEGLKEARAGVAALKTLASTNGRALDAGLRDALHRFGTDIDAMQVRAEGYRPYAVHCEAGCSVCKGRGWLSKREHEAMVRGQEARR